MTMSRPSLSQAAALAVCLALLVACSGKSDGTASASESASAAASGAAGAASGPAAAASAPPVSVTLVRAQKRDVPVLLESTGTVVPLSSVDVRPQMTSVVSKVHIREGQFVRAGELLFTLDSRADEANVAKVRAQMARDEASLADARRQLQRSRELLAQNFISQGAVDASQAAVDAQTALVASDKAAVDAARVSLSYARITAPGAGRVGTIPVFEGSAVQANQTTLVTITRLDPISVSFNLPQRHLGDALAALKEGGSDVVATLPDKGATLTGKLQFVDNAVDAASGTVKVKAQFDNKTGQLWPGAFANVRMTVRTLKDAVVIPQAAVVQSPRGTVVFTVGEGNKAVPRRIEVLYAQGEDAAVGGLKPGERIVLDGRQNVRPGSILVERAREGGARASGAAAGASGAGSGAGRGRASEAAAGASGPLGAQRGSTAP
jgi:RND family efflux transporter MFP subunit